MTTIYYLLGEEGDEGSLHSTSIRAVRKEARELAEYDGEPVEIWAAEIDRPSMALVLTLLSKNGGGWAKNARVHETIVPKRTREEVIAEREAALDAEYGHEKAIIR